MRRRVEASALDGVALVESEAGIVGDEEVKEENVGGSDVPWRRSCCTSWVARTWCVRSRGIRVVLAARRGLEKMEDAASGSHCHNNDVQPVSDTPSGT